MHSHHTGKSLFASKPGAGAAIPYAGLRLGVSDALSEPEARMSARHGIWLQGKVDLSSETKRFTYEVSNSNIFHPDVRQVEATTVVGGHLLFGLSYTFGFDAS